MDTRLLRMARRDTDGTRCWAVPGTPGQHIRAIPSGWTDTRSNVSSFSVRWPHFDLEHGWSARSARFDWHGRMAFREIRKLLRGRTCDEN